MTTEFLATRREELVGDLLRRIKRDQGEAETVYWIYVVDEQGALEGVVSTRELLEASLHERVGDIMNPDVIRVRVDDDQEEVAHRLLHYNLNTIPVVDPRGALVGIVTADDALEVLEEEGSEDALLLAGASRSAGVGAPFVSRVGHRAPMLGVTVLAGLAMSRVMDWFVPGALDEGSAVGRLRVILPYVPMVLGLAGNVGSQTAAVLVRGFATGEIQPDNRRAVFLDEVQVGSALGLLCALLAVPAAVVFAGSWWTALSLGVALLLAVSWSATLACSIAIGSQAAGLDPALVSGPVMMACSDLSATLLFFTSSHLLLGAA
jgi:magnesium transporter